MDWCRLSTSFYHDPSLLRAGEQAEVLFLRCVAYSGAQESKGVVPKHVLPMLTPTKTRQRTAALIREGLLLDSGSDVRIRSWDRWQESLDAESERRRKDRERKARERAIVRDLSEVPSADEPPMSSDMSVDLSSDSPRGVRPEKPRIEVEVEEEKKRAPGKPSAPPRLDVEQVCSAVVAAEVAKNSKRPTVTDAWRREARLLLDRDGRSLAEVLAVIEWTRDHKFWRSNIRSVPKLREQFDTLRLQREDSRPSTPAYRGHSALNQSSPSYDPHLEHLANW